MSELNYNTLEENIRMLMRNKDITQQKLAEIAGMTQANVSKALNPNEKKHFTLDQIYRIAQAFDVSIDKLVGNTPAESSETSPREAFQFIIKYLCAANLRTAKLTVQETAYEFECIDYGEYRPHDIQNEYPVFFFPDYERISDYHPATDEEYIDLQSMFFQCGNDTKYRNLNKIFKKIIPLVAQFKEGDIPEEAFQMIVEGYLRQLPEK